MARFRLSAPAQSDLETILATSLERWGEQGQARYASLLSASFRAIAQNPTGPTTKARDDLVANLRSFHIRHGRRGHGVRTPVHLVYDRVIDPDVIEVVRVLHERMDPMCHFNEATEPTKRPRRR